MEEVSQLPTYFRDSERTPSRLRGAVLALGNFDGIHLGHQAVLRTARGLAEREGSPLLLATFEPHPRRLFRTEREPFRLTPSALRLALVGALGVDGVLAFRFTSAFAGRSAESFVGETLQGQLAVRAVVVGAGFRFGSRRLGTVETLRGLGVETEVVAPYTLGGEVVSSSAIRALLRDGQAEQAGRFLGRPYAMMGRVVRGAGRGADLAMATANVRCGRYLAPKYGVYAVRGVLHPTDSSSNSSSNSDSGAVLDGVANFGVRPMYPSADPLLEAHFFADLPALYGRRISVSFLSYLREERKFESAAQLVAQMQDDKKQAQAVLAQIPLENSTL